MMEKIVFDFSKLKGLIVEKYNTVADFSKVIDISESSLSKKLTNDVIFKPDDIYRISDVLGISENDIGVYFFTIKQT